MAKVILNATTGQLKSASIIKCDEVLYGTHGSDNHYHLAEETTDGKYKAVGDSLGSNWTCKGTLKNINEDKILEKVKACVHNDKFRISLNPNRIENQSFINDYRLTTKQQKRMSLKQLIVLKYMLIQIRV